MKKPGPSGTAIRFVAHLPDLMTATDYTAPDSDHKVRVRISVTEQGIEILGDALNENLLEDLLNKIGAKEMERMLCG